jgi:hypothetical protein
VGKSDHLINAFNITVLFTGLKSLWLPAFALSEISFKAILDEKFSIVVLNLSKIAFRLLN